MPKRLRFSDTVSVREYPVSVGDVAQNVECPIGLEGTRYWSYPQPLTTTTDQGRRRKLSPLERRQRIAQVQNCTIHHVRALEMELVLERLDQALQSTKPQVMEATKCWPEGLPFSERHNVLFASKRTWIPVQPVTSMGLEQVALQLESLVTQWLEDISTRNERDDVEICAKSC